jgi:hypothetical protein
MPLFPLQSATELLVWAIVIHIVADWLLQTEWMAANKTDLRHPAGWVHAGSYALLMALIFPLGAVLLIGVAHLLIDTRVPVTWWLRVVKRVREEQRSPILEMAVDQSFHVVILAIAALLLT